MYQSPSYQPEQGRLSPSRRTFLKRSTSAIVGARLAAELAVVRGAHGQGSDVIRIGLVGCGGRGTGVTRFV